MQDPNPRVTYMPAMRLLRQGLLLAGALAALAQDSAVQLDEAGDTAVVALATDEEMSWKYDDAIEEQLKNLTVDERQEVEQTLDAELRRANLTGGKDKKNSKKATTTSSTTTRFTTTHSTTKRTEAPKLAQATSSFAGAAAALVQEDESVSRVEGTATAPKPLTDKEIDESLTAQSLQDPEVLKLEDQHDNLSQLVKIQAQIVAQESTSLNRGNEAHVKNRKVFQTLAAQYEHAHEEALNDTEAYKVHLAAVAVTKKKRDDLKKKLDQARQHLEEVSPKYHAAEYHYGILMSRTPYLEDRANVSTDLETKHAEVLKAAVEKQAKSKAVVTIDDARLEAAMSKLTSLHSELAKIEGKLAKKLELKSSAPFARTSWFVFGAAVLGLV